MSDSRMKVEGTPHHLQDWAQRLWLPLVGMGVAILLIGFLVGIINQGNAARWFGSPVNERLTAGIGGVNADLNDLRSFVTIKTWLTPFAVLGLAFVVAGISSAIGLVILTMREESRQLQVRFGHNPLAPAKDSNSKLLPWLMVSGLVLVTIAFAVALIRSTMVSDFYQSSEEVRLAVTAGDLSLNGSIEALGAWIPPLLVV